MCVHRFLAIFRECERSDNEILVKLADLVETVYTLSGILAIKKFFSLPGFIAIKE